MKKGVEGAGKFGTIPLFVSWSFPPVGSSLWNVPRGFRTNAGLASHLLSRGHQVQASQANHPEHQEKEDSNSDVIFIPDFSTEAEDLTEAERISSLDIMELNQLQQSKPPRFHPYQNVSQFLLARCFHKGKLNRPQKKLIYDLITDPRFQRESLPWNCLSDMEKRELTLSNRERFKKHTVIINGLSFEFFIRDIVKVALELFSDPSFSEEFSPKFVLQTNEKGERLRGEFYTADWMMKMQDKIPQGASLAAVLLYADEKRVAKKGGKKLYPVYVSLGNFTCQARRKKRARRVVAFLPVLKEPNSEKKKRAFANLKLLVNQACFKRLLVPLKACERTLVKSKDPSGKFRMVAVKLAALITDWMEGSKLTLVKNLPSLRCCHVCYLPRHLFHDFAAGKSAQLRTTASTRRILRMALRHRTKEGVAGKAKLKQMCVFRLENCFWDLKDFEVYQSCPFDSLHTFDLGLFEWTLIFLYRWIEDAHDERKAEEIRRTIEDRFSEVPPFPGLQLFPSGVEKVAIDGKGKFQGKEYRSIMKQIAIVLAGLVPNAIFAVFTKFLSFYKKIKLPSFTSSDLNEVEDLAESFVKALQVFKNYSPSQLRFPKIHAISHLRLFLSSYGAMENVDTEQYEKYHHEAAQIPYEASNKQSASVAQQIARHMDREDNLASISWDDQGEDEEEERQESEQEEEECAGGPDRLLGKGKKTFVSSLENPIKTVLQRHFRNDLIKTHLSTVAGGRRVFAGTFRGKSRNSTIDFAAKGGNAYGKVLLLFQADDSQWALIQLLRTDHTRYDHQTQLDSALLHCLELTQRFKIIRLKDIAAPVHIVPHFGAGAGKFLLNHFAH